MIQTTTNKSRGFTLVEILVAVGIVVTIASVAYASLADARSVSRDRQRMADILQLQLGLRAYAERESTYPACTGGFRFDTNSAAGSCADESAMQTGLASIYDTLPQDPTSDNEYYYQYESGVNCSGTGQSVVYARRLEKPSYSNYTDVCSCTTGSCGFSDGTPTEGYIILIDD